MNLEQPPPSLSSTTIRSTDHVSPTTDPTATDPYNQPMSFSSHFPNHANSLNHDVGLNRGLNLNLNNSYGYGYSYSDQPPSMGAVRPIQVSQPSGGVDHYGFGQPPSFNAVGARPGSQTGGMYNDNIIADPGALAGMSLTANTFRMVDPNAFHKDNNIYGN